MSAEPTVTIAVPVLNEEAHLAACLDAILSQSYPRIVEVLVLDGGSTDRTQQIAEATPQVTVIHNPGKLQAAALNIALERAKGEVLVRVDGHTIVARDYVERCVEALVRTKAAMVGGAMVPATSRGAPRGIALALSSRLGAGPARFHGGTRPGWVDTVYLGAFWVEQARAVGGYAADMPTNEDAEFAHRLGECGGVWFDPAIRSTYRPRKHLRVVAHQFFRYGRGRAVTVRRHPSSLAPRQLAAPLLILGLVSPWRRWFAGIYLSLVLARSTRILPEDPIAAVTFAGCLPTMHVSWGLGFLSGLATPCRRYRRQR